MKSTKQPGRQSDMDGATLVSRFNECNRGDTIHRPNVSTLLSSTLIRGDLIAATRGPFICSLISCPFFCGGVNRRQVVSPHHHDLKERGRGWYARLPNKGAGGIITIRRSVGGVDMPGFLTKRWWKRRLMVLILDLSHLIVWLVRHVCSDKAEFSFWQNKTAFCSFKRLLN